MKYNRKELQYKGPRKYRSNVDTDQVFREIRSRRDVLRHFEFANNIINHFDTDVHPSNMVAHDFDEINKRMAFVETAIGKIIQLAEFKTFMDDPQYSDEEFDQLMERYESLDAKVQDLRFRWISRN